MAEELRQLGDFYDPTRTGLQAMMVMQGQQNLLQHQQRLDQQNANLEVDNLRQAYMTANPMDSYPAYKAYAERMGLPVPAVNTFYANPAMFDAVARAEPGTQEHADATATLLATDPRSRAAVGDEFMRQSVLRGARKANVRAGLGSDLDTAEFTVASKPVQEKLAGALVQTPLQQEQTAALAMKNREHEDLVANVNTQMSALLPISKTARVGLDRAAPFVAQLASIQQEYDKNLKSKGVNAAAGMRRDRILANPELEQFNQRGQQSIDGLAQQVQQIEDKQAELLTHAELVANGVIPLREGQSLHMLAGTIDASVKHLALVKAQLAFAKDKTQANFDAVRTAVDDIDTHLTALTEKKNASQDSLDIRRDAQQETAQEHRLTRERVSNIGKAQVAWMEAGGDPKQAHRFAKQFGVKVSEVTEAGKDPNRAPVEVSLTQEKKEAQTVGTGFGEQYLESQKAGRAAMTKLGRIDRMESLLQGVATGKLTPLTTDIAAMADAFGIKIDTTLPAKQAIESLTNEMALELRNPAGGAGMPGAMSDKDREFLIAMPAGLNKTPAGNRLILDTYRAVARRDVQIAKMAREYRKRHGQLDEGFYDDVQEYADRNPLFAGKTAAPAQAAPTPPTTGMTPTVPQFHDPEKQKRYEEFKKKHRP